MSSRGVAVTDCSSNGDGLALVPHPLSPTVQVDSTSELPSVRTATSRQVSGPLTLDTANETWVPQSFFSNPASSRTPVRGSEPPYRSPGRSGPPMPAPPSDSGSGSSCVLERCAVVAGAFSCAGANHLAPANSAP